LIDDAYHQTRLPYDKKREIVWRAPWKLHFSKLDNLPGCLEHLSKDVEGHVGDATDLSLVERRSVDFAFASKLFEHLSKDCLAVVLAQLSEKLTAGGKLARLQPNYHYAFKEYFDDYQRAYLAHEPPPGISSAADHRA
jgi:hypothetical protein